MQNRIRCVSCGFGNVGGDCECTGRDVRAKYRTCTYEPAMYVSESSGRAYGEESISITDSFDQVLEMEA